ncbi:MAG: SUMF1/EgtB/PvdO family nonheme iron enzyme [Cyanobacteria bacterium P01_D01_bin.156]
MAFQTSLKQTSSPDPALHNKLQTILQSCRQGTLELVQEISSPVLKQQAHPDFSPVGWHLGHIAFTESLWILEHLAQQPCPYPHYRTLFAADGLPKAQRQQLPDLETLLNFLTDIRQRTLAYLATAPLHTQKRLWYWLVQHECQHSETISLVMALHQHQGKLTPLKETAQIQLPSVSPGMVQIPGGRVCLGPNESTQDSSEVIAIDNEQPSYEGEVEAFRIARTPVTCGQFAKFMDAGGYQERQWWCDEGWHWLQSNSSHISQPLYWPEHRLQDFRDYPVSGVNWYEASAYARFIGKRLPTEIEWAMAAQGLTKNRCELLAANQINCNHRLGHTSPVGAYHQAVSDYGCFDLLGNVWEWTNSWFRPYPGFESYPYKGYSEAYFDDRHRVLRGGSWATRPWALRPSFRNWYEPHVRELFMGFRCAQ